MNQNVVMGFWPNHNFVVQLKSKSVPKRHAYHFFSFLHFMKIFVVFVYVCVYFFSGVFVVVCCNTLKFFIVTWFGLCRSVVRVLINPIVSSVFIGLLVNVATGGQLGEFNGLFQTLKLAFPASALFLLGNSMVGSGASLLKRKDVFVIVALVVIKVLVAPVFLQLILSALGGMHTQRLQITIRTDSSFD
jgi:hypothetical protein